MNVRSAGAASGVMSSGRMEPLEVAVIEDDPVIRDGLQALIDGTPGYRCRAVFASVEAALRGLAAFAPRVILLDIHLEGMLGSRGVPLLREKFPGAQVVMLTVYSHEDEIFESIRNGACGYLLKGTPPARLLSAIAEAADGGAPMSPEIARKVIELFQRTRPAERLKHDLTPHEVRLLGLLSRGHSYERAAEEFGISVNTLRNYIRSIYQKLHVHSKSEAVSKALRGGIL